MREIRSIRLQDSGLVTSTILTPIIADEMPGFPIHLLRSIPFLVLFALIIVTGCTGPDIPAGNNSPAMVVTPAPVNVTTNETLVAFVNEAVQYAREHGREAAIAEFNRKNGSFVRGELYIYAYDNNITTLAHPVNPELIGRSRLDEPDAFGNPYAYKFISALDGSGYLWFYYHNPVHNNAIEQKLGYVARVDDTWWLGSGVYYGPVDQPAAPVSGTPSTTQDLKAFVDTAADYARQQGKDAALASFGNRSGPFSRGDLYIYALDYDGRALALPYQPQLVGTSFSGTQDASGRYYTRTEIYLAQDGGGYLVYQYPDPAQNFTVRYKISYVRPVDDTYWIGAGIYTNRENLADEELRNFVKEAKAYALANGRERALREFNDKNGSFVRDGLYIFADDYHGTVLAWPYRPDLIGVNRINETDAVGQYHFRSIIETARTGSGIVDYYTVDPATNTTRLKISYVTDVDGTWLVGAGRYIGPDTTNLRD